MKLQDNNGVNPFFCVRQRVESRLASLLFLELHQIENKEFFISDFNMDSLDLAELHLDLEDEFDVDFPIDENEVLQGLDDLEKYIKLFLVKKEFNIPDNVAVNWEDIKTINEYNKMEVYIESINDVKD